MADWVEKAFKYISNDIQWSVGPLMSVVLPLQIPERCEVDPSTKAVWKMRANTFKLMKKKATSLFYDFILLYVWVFYKRWKKRVKKLFFIYV